MLTFSKLIFLLGTSIYVLVLINSNILVLLQISPSTGLTNQNIYVIDSSSSSTIYSFIDMTWSDNIVYIMASSSSESFIHSYNQNTQSIGSSYSTTSFKAESSEFLDSMYVLVGINNGGSCGVFK